jgi:hypothetical protein
VALIAAVAVPRGTEAGPIPEASSATVVAAPARTEPPASRTKPSTSTSTAPPPDSQLAVRSVFHAQCDIVNEVDADCRRWPERWDAALRDDPPDAVIVIGGLRQLFDLGVDGQRLPVGSPDWERTYRRAVRRALGVIRHGLAAPVLWFDVPCSRWDAEGTDGEEHDTRRIEIINAALRDELAADDLTVPATHDLWRWLEPIVLQALAERVG